MIWSMCYEDQFLYVLCQGSKNGHIIIEEYRTTGKYLPEVYCIGDCPGPERQSFPMLLSQIALGPLGHYSNSLVQYEEVLRSVSSCEKCSPRMPSS